MRDLRSLVPLVVLILCVVGCGQTPADINNAGHIPYLGGDYTSALEHYESAAERDPGAAEPSYNTGNALYRIEEFGASMRRYDQSLQDAEGELRLSGFFNRGNASFQMGRYTEAVEAYKEALRINADDADAKHNLELALRQLPPQAQAQQEDAQQQDQASQEQSEQAQDTAQEPPAQSQDNRQDEQSRDEREQDQDREGRQETPPPGEIAMSDAGARQILESVGEEAQTLQETEGAGPGVAKSPGRVRLVGHGVKSMLVIRLILGSLALLSVAAFAFAPEVRSPRNHLQEPLFVEASVDDDRPYIGQQTAYVFRIYRRSDYSPPAGEMRYEPPGFAGFWNSAGSDPEGYSERREYSETIGSREYSVVELRTLLFPTVAGQTEIGACQIVGPGRHPGKRFHIR